MIRSEHSIVHYDFRQLVVTPDRLLRSRDADYLDAAKQLLNLYSNGAGEPRQELHYKVETILSRIPGCPPRRIAALCKLLDDHGEYTQFQKEAVKLRKRLFQLAAPMHPIVTQREGIFEHELHTARQKIAAEIGMSWPEIEANLFADVIELQRLESFHADLSPADLLSIYNVAQTQSVLYRATRVRLDATEDFKTILRHAKLAGLMHRIQERRIGNTHGYRFVFDGPQASLRETTRYGVRFAALLPKLLACGGWKLTAEILGPRKQKFRLDISPADGLRSVHAAPSDFDSALEEDIDHRWHAAPVAGWAWHRESQLLAIGQTVMTPDFTLVNEQSGEMIYVEVVGFWTPEYLEEKCSRLRIFMETHPDAKWLLIIPEKLAQREKDRFAMLSIPIVHFTKRMKPQAWIDAVMN